MASTPRTLNADDALDVPSMHPRTSTPARASLRLPGAQPPSKPVPSAYLRPRAAWRTLLALVLAGPLASPVAGQSSLRAVPDQRFGTLDGAGTLSYVTDALVLADGSIVVADAREPSLKLFDEKGGFVRAIGAAGDGSGTFQRISGIGLLVDSIWVADMGAFRQTLFDADGDVLAERRIASRSAPDRPHAQLALLLEGGRAIAPPALPDRPAADATLPLLLLDYTGTPLDTVAWLRVGTTSLRLDAPGGDTISISGGEAFRSDPLWAVHPAGRGVVSLVQGLPLVGDSAGFVVEWTGAGGESRYRRTIRYMPARVAPEHVDAVVAHIMRGDRWVDRFGSRDALEAAIREKLGVPEFLPAVTDLVAGRDGTVWLKRTGRWSTSDARWTVIDADGATIADVTVPRDAEVLAAQRDALWAFVIDDAGVPYVVRYRIE